jgi:hypothetical protein
MALSEWSNGDPTYLTLSWKISADNIVFVNIVNKDNPTVRQQKPLGALVSTRYSKKPAIFTAGQECSASFLVGIASSAHAHPYDYILQEKDWYVGTSNDHFTSLGKDYWQQFLRPNGRRADKGMWLKSYLKKAVGVDGDNPVVQFATTQFSSRASSPEPVNRSSSSSSSGSSNSRTTPPNVASGGARRTSTEKKNADSPILVGTNSPNQQLRGKKAVLLFRFCVS